MKSVQCQQRVAQQGMMKENKMCTDESKSGECSCGSCETTPVTNEPTGGVEVKIHNMGIFSPSGAVDMNQADMFKALQLDIENNAKKIIIEAQYIPPVVFFFMDNNEIKLMELSEYLTDGFDAVFGLIRHFVETKKDPSICGVILVTGALIALDKNPENKDPSNLKEVMVFNIQNKDGVKITEIPVIRAEDKTITFGLSEELSEDVGYLSFFNKHES